MNTFREKWLFACNVALVNKCNFSCDFCFEVKNTGPTQYLDVEVLKAALLDLGIDHVGFSRYEPLLHPKINEILRWCKENNIHTCVVTNGEYLNDLKFFPDKISIGADINISDNVVINQWLTENQAFRPNIEITMTPTDASKMIEFVDYYENFCNYINISMLACWDKNPTVLNYVTPLYKQNLKILAARRAVRIHGMDSPEHIEDFYNGTNLFEYECKAPINIYADGKIELCGSDSYEKNATIASYNKVELKKSKVHDKGMKSLPCSACNGRRVISATRSK